METETAPLAPNVRGRVMEIGTAPPAFNVRGRVTVSGTAPPAFNEERGSSWIMVYASSF
jgi:hypothetical protein